MNKLITSLLLTLLCATAWADTFYVKPFKYNTVSANTVEVAGVMPTSLITLTDANVPSSVTFGGNTYTVVGVAKEAFKSNPRITKLTLPSTIQTVGENAFYGASALKSATITSGSIERGAFAVCEKLSTIILAGVTSLKSLAFTVCTALTQVTIPNSLTEFPPTAFTGCSQLTAFSVASNHPTYSAYNGVLYNKDKTTLCHVPVGKTSVTDIWTDNVTHIAPNAMSSCEQLTSVDIPYGVTTMGERVFLGCTALTEVAIPSSVTTLGDYMFVNCEALTDLYVNMSQPATITSSTMLRGSNTPNLHTPYGTVLDYLDHGWTDFASYNKDDVVSYDLMIGKLAYSVIAIANHLNHYEHFDGGCKLVCSKKSSTISGTVTVPEYVTIRGKKLAVQTIDSHAFNATSPYSVLGCLSVQKVNHSAFEDQPIVSIELPYVQEIHDYAFKGCTNLTTAKWGIFCTRIMTEAFANSGLTSDIFLPPGAKVGSLAFNGVKSKKVVIPFTCDTESGYYPNAFNNMAQLETIVSNREKPAGFKFDGTPSTCKVIVPVGCVDAYKNYGAYRNFSNIEEGACEFALDDNPNTPYRVTVTNENFGYAKYVYNKNIKSSGLTTFQTDHIVTLRLNGSWREFKMTGIGRQCFEGSNLTSIDLTKMEWLEDIEPRAFHNTKLRQAEINSIYETTIGQDAFAGIPTLSRIVFNSKVTFDMAFFGNNSKDFVVYFNHSDSIADFYSRLKNAQFGNGDMCSDHMGLLFKSQGATTFALGLGAPVEFGEQGGVKAYAIDNVNPSTTTAHAKRVAWAPQGQGVLLTGLSDGNTYLFGPKKGSVALPHNNMLVAATQATDLYVTRDSYYWNSDNERFECPTSTYKVQRGDCYLSAPGNAAHYTISFDDGGKKGDVNGDGTIDVTDVNLTINVMLGKATKAQYPAADVNGDGTVDVTDVNLIINIMLGK